ncbi:MAG: hypothetical protein ACKO7W_08870 [Elainella sp.]
MTLLFFAVAAWTAYLTPRLGNSWFALLHPCDPAAATSSVLTSGFVRLDAISFDAAPMALGLLSLTLIALIAHFCFRQLLYYCST